MPRIGALDVLAQHVLGIACADPFARRRALRARSSRPRPMRSSTRESFDAVVDFVATGGYALRAYERFAKIMRRARTGSGAPRPRASSSNTGMNVGTIVEAAMLKVRLGRLAAARPGAPAATGILQRTGRVLGELEEYSPSR